MSDIKALQKRALEIREKYAALERAKYGREWTPAEIMAGFVGDVGDLSKLTMAKAGIREKDDLDEKVAHELADCLWSVLVLAERYGVDIEATFTKTMDELETRIAKEQK